MPRTDDDTWGITESVGATALGVAAARAAETESEHPLISDPFARLFVDAAGPGIWSLYGSALGDDIDPQVKTLAQAMVDFMAVRTLFFDEFFHAATDGGLRQVVILASGLDARVWRLPWPDDTTVYELDRPEVLDFKTATLAPHAAHPRADLVYVPVDLRQDWPRALQDGGFDTTRPTAWLAEGLLRYLTAADQDRLIDRIHALSAPASWLGANAAGAAAIEPARLARQHDRMRLLREAAARLVGDEYVVDLEQLWYPEPRADIRDQLAGHGWHVSTTTLAEMLARNDRPLTAAEVFSNYFVSAQLNWP